MAGGDDAARVSAAADALREGLGVDSDDEAAAAEPPPAPAASEAGGAARGEGGGAPTSLAAQVEQLKETIDGLKAALHAERTTVRDKDMQIHKLLAERDLVVGAHPPGAACFSRGARILAGCCAHAPRCAAPSARCGRSRGRTRHATHYARLRNARRAACSAAAEPVTRR